MSELPPTQRDLDMMRHAIALAKEAGESGEVPVAAVRYDDDGIVATGSNRREMDCDPTGHAEIVALREAGP